MITSDALLFHPEMELFDFRQYGALCKMMWSSFKISSFVFVIVSQSVKYISKDWSVMCIAVLHVSTSYQSGLVLTAIPFSHQTRLVYRCWWQSNSPGDWQHCWRSPCWPGLTSDLSLLTTSNVGSESSSLGWTNPSLLSLSSLCHLWKLFSRKCNINWCIMLDYLG